jgi:radical SAM superfamily enzyme YgiQ (UPF0313 family)
MLATVREAKQRGKTVVVGGPLAFHIPQQFLNAGADIVVRGEAETAMPLLLDALANGRSGIIIEESGKPELSDSPLPRFDLLEMDIYADMAVQFSRGCPFRCEFCDVTLLNGRRVRTKAPAQVLAELQWLYDLGWRRSVFFVDDNFIGHRVPAKALLDELIPWMTARHHPFVFTTQASVNLANDPAMLEQMVQAGFTRVFLGIETQDVASLQRAQKLQNAGVDLDVVCQTITRAGLQIIAGCIIGFDHETAGADQRLIDFATRNHIPEMFITPLQAGPGTDLWHRLEKEQRLTTRELDDATSSQAGVVNFVPTRPLSEITAELVRLYDVLYEPGFYTERTCEHLARMSLPTIARRFALPNLGELRAVALTVFRQGILYPSRGKFWRCLGRAVTCFPQRVPQFLAACVMGEHYNDYRQIIRQRLSPPLSKPIDGSVDVVT